MSFRQRLYPHRHTLVLVAAIAVYATVFSYATIQKHRDFHSYAWDLGVFNQVMYSSVYGGRLFHYTCDSYLNVEENYLAFHFSPILVLLFPLYYLFPYPSLLLMLKSTALAAAAYPLYRIGVKITDSQTVGLAAAILYLLQPGLQASNWFDFQPQVFAPLLIFTSYYLFLEGRWAGYLTSLFTSLIVEEHLFIVQVAVLGGHYLVNRGEIKTLTDKDDPKTRAVAISLALMAFVFAASVYTKRLYPVRPEFLGVYWGSSAFDILGFKGSGFTLPIYMLSNPSRLAAALLYDLDLKLLYFLFLYAPLLFLPLMNAYTLPVTALFSPFYLSNYRAYYTLGAHYYTYVVTAILIPFLYTLRGFGAEQAERLSRYSLAVSIILLVALSPLSPASHDINRNQQILWYPNLSRTRSEVDNLAALVECVPRDASVLTMNHVFPHVSSRVNAYTIPLLDLNETLSREMAKYIDGLILKTEYVLLDLHQLDRWSRYVFTELLEGGQHTIYVSLDNAVLFKRGRGGSSAPLPGTTPREYKAVHDLQLGPHVKIVDMSIVDTVALSPKGSKPKLFAYGPYTFLPPGAYNVTFHIKVVDPDPGALGTIQVLRNMKEPVTCKTMWSHEHQEGAWSRQTIILVLDEASELTEFQVHTTGTADLYLHKIEVSPLADTYPNPSATRSIAVEDLASPGAAATPEGYLRSTPLTERAVWYGPYIQLEPGSHAAVFHVKPSPTSEQPDATIVTLDVVTDSGRTGLAVRNLTAANLAVGEWTMVRLPFTLEEPARVEFRGIDLGQGWEIRLAEVTLEPLPTGGEP